MDNSLIIDDLGEELNLNDNDIENIVNNEEEEEDDDDKNRGNIELLKKSENSTEKSLDIDFRLDKNINQGNTQNVINISNNSIKIDQGFNNMIKENINDLNTIFNSLNVNLMKNELNCYKKMDLDE